MHGGGANAKLSSKVVFRLTPNPRREPGIQPSVLRALHFSQNGSLLLRHWKTHD